MGVPTGGRQSNRDLQIASLDAISLRLFHVLGLNETKLNKDIKDLEVELESLKFTVKIEMLKEVM